MDLVGASQRPKPALGVLIPGPSRELYLWACTIMTSRCFPGPAVFDQKENHLPTHDQGDGRSPVLIPGVDLLNHNPSSRVAWLWDSTICAIKNDEAVPAGSQVPNNYGPKGNAERRVFISVLNILE